MVGGSVQVLGVWWNWLCSPGTLHLPSLFPHSLLLSSLFLATLPPPEAHGWAGQLSCVWARLWLSGGTRKTNVNALIASWSYADLTPPTLVHLTVLFRDHLKL